MIPRLLFHLVVALLFAPTLLAQPGKDCTTPLVVNSLPFTQLGMTTAGFGDDYSVSPCGNPFMEGDDFVITYTPVADEKISILLQNVSEWTGLHVLDDCPDVAGTCIASDLSPSPGVRLIDDLLVLGGTTYYLVISTFPAPQSTGFDLTILTNGPPGAGSNCSTPKVINDLPFTEQGTNTSDFGNNYSGSGPCVTDNYLNGNEVVYTYTPNVNQAVAIEVTNISDFFAGVQVMTKCPDDNPECIASAVNTSIKADLIIENLFLELGETYFIVVSTFENPETVIYDLNIFVQQACAPPASVSFSNTTSTSTDVSWPDDALFWNIETVPSGTTPSGIGQQVNLPTTNLSALAPESNYDVYLQSHCAPASLMITGVYDGPRSAGTPKGVELFALHDIVDLSRYGLGSANNGDGTDGEEFTFPTMPVLAGTFIYVASDSVEFNEFFGFFPNFLSPAAAINGDDAIELFYQNTVIDQFGFIDVDGTGQDWEYKDGWAARKSGQRNNNGIFDSSKWTYSGPDELEGGPTNATCDVPFPIGQFVGVSSIPSVWGGPYPFRTKPTPPVCGGFFVDEGGFSSSYFSNSLDSITICPTNSDDLVAVAFTSFAVENNGLNCLDELLIYDGADTNGSVFSSPNGNTDGWCWDATSTGDQGSGNLAGMSIMATNPTGCLTFIFNSNADTELAGWEASVSCQPRVECNAPTNLNTAQVSNNFAELIWETATMSSLQTSISWGVQGTLPQAGNQVMVTGNNYLLTGLLPTTTYDFYVSEDCGNGANSGWTGPFTFTTTDCSVVGDILANPIVIPALPFAYLDNTAACYSNTMAEPSADVFFSYTTGQCEYALLINTCSSFSDFDTYVYLLDDQGTILDSNDESPAGTCDINLNGENRFSVLEVAVEPNTTYVIMVEGFGPNEGNFELSVEKGNISPIGIGWNLSEVTCFNDSDGAINLDISGGASPYAIEWSNGETTPDLAGLPAGTYVVTIEDACTNFNTATIVLTNPDSLSIEATAFPTDPGQSNGYVTSSVQGGVAPYVYVWDDGTTTSTIINRGVGGYCVRVTDARGCSAIDCDEISFNTATAELEDLQQFQIYPNPTFDQITLEVALIKPQDLRFQIIDVHGKIVHNWQDQAVAKASYQVDFSDYPAGIYWVKITGEQGSSVERVVKVE